MNASVPQPAGIGHNSPPEPTPFERVRDRISNLYAEAAMWLDGEPIATQGQADDLSNLLNMIRDAKQEAEEARKAEAKPFDDGKAEVQARYAPLIADTKSVKGMTTLAVEACKKALAPWLEKLADEKEAIARKAREEADAQRQAAKEAVRAAQAATDLAAREAAEQRLQEAKKAEALAKKAESDTAKSGGGVGRRVSLHTYYIAEIHDLKEFAGHVWTNYRDDIRTYLAQRAQWLVDQGKRDIPGVTVREDRRAQ
jgi:NADH dehydrogenase/NADH:ubiquinone oxidoreductase subunit G